MDPTDHTNTSKLTKQHVRQFSFLFWCVKAVFAFTLPAIYDVWEGIFHRVGKYIIISSDPPRLHKRPKSRTQFN